MLCTAHAKGMTDGNQLERMYPAGFKVPLLGVCLKTRKMRTRKTSRRSEGGGLEREWAILELSIPPVSKSSQIDLRHAITPAARESRRIYFCDERNEVIVLWTVSRNMYNR